jgi:CheY-like chemotaxis protein
VPPGAQDEKVEEAGEELASGSGQMILLVDDEEDLLEIGREMLELNHFRTVTAEDGEGAVQLLAAHKEQITLVILDLNMPGMGGFSCLERLLEMKPSLKVIVVTGYLGAEQMQRVLKSGASGYIAKPYRFHEMLKKITEVLNAPAPGA